MTHLLLLLVCILSVEILIRLNFLFFLGSILKVTRKVTHVLPQNKISDHWKEKIIPAYALKLMQYSVRMFFILLLVLSLFFITDFFLHDFLNFSISLIGISESIIFGFIYLILRKTFTI